MDKDWHKIRNVAEVPSPALVLYPDRIEQNIEKMISIAGSANKLRPHIKTHKIPEIIRLHLNQGITKFKCATIAEAEMAASAGASDVLLAYQPVGPAVDRLFELESKYYSTNFSTIVDDLAVLTRLGQAFRYGPRPLQVFLDIDCGMRRSGIEPGEKAAELYKKLCQTPGLRAAGLHVYDGHIHESHPVAREQMCEEAFQQVDYFRRQLEAEGFHVPLIVAGGTPTFPIHARRENTECSPGTCVLWDAGYGHKFPDLDFKIAAVLVSRVVSKPTPSRICLDLGHKAVAAENPQPRVEFLNLGGAQLVMHSEEHLVVESVHAAELAVGDILYAIPKHICPTVALHNEVFVARENMAQGTWQVAARGRKIFV